ncbi:MAG: HAD family hydrolase [Bacteroidales bacterium]|nr:HAD family hydrolase [Bacteroidales bacterium]
MVKPDALIFDMDGTLWDAVDSYVWIWNESFRQLGINKIVSKNDLIDMMGKQPDEIIKRTLEGEENQDIELVYKTVFGLQEKVMPLLGGKLYDGVKEGIDMLSTRYKLFILSNCEHYAIKQFLEYTKLNDFFTDNLSFGDTKLPKAMNMQLLCARHQLQNAVYIGDTLSDQIQTQKAGLPFFFVNYGFGKTESFAKEFSHFNELTNYFMDL